MIVLRGKEIIKIIVDDERQLLAYCAGNTLLVDTSYRHLSSISIQRTVKWRHTYCRNNAINKIFSLCRNCYLCKNNMLVDSEIADKIKWALADDIAKEIENNSMERKASVNVNSIIDSLPTEIFNNIIAMMKCVMSSYVKLC